MFGRADEAVRAALQTQEGVSEVEVEGHTPTIRAGVHVGRPRRVGSDYLGVDVNIAARVGECAKAGEVLVSDPARAAMDEDRFQFGRRRRLRESGAPRDLSVHSVSAA